MKEQGPMSQRLHLSLGTGSWFRIKSILDFRHPLRISHLFSFHSHISKIEKAKVFTVFSKTLCDLLPPSSKTLSFIMFVLATMASLGSLFVLFPPARKLYTQITPLLS